VRFYVEVLRGVLLKGAGLADLWSQLVLLAVFGVAVLTVASRRFHKTAA
jgi:ABC-2 type transport system permease protein